MNDFLEVDLYESSPLHDRQEYSRCLSKVNVTRLDQNGLLKIMVNNYKYI